MLRALCVTVIVLTAACSRERPPETAPTPAPAPKVEVRHAFEIAVVPPPEGPAVGALVTRARASIAAGRRPVVQAWASWCPSCQDADEEMARERVRGELAGIEILRVDIDAWQDTLDELPVRVEAVPSFLQLSATGELTGKLITSTAWEDSDRPMSDVLRAFAHGR